MYVVGNFVAERLYHRLLIAPTTNAKFSRAPRDSYHDHFRLAIISRSDENLRLAS
jgi:hypothetical protein